MLFDREQSRDLILQHLGYSQEEITKKADAARALLQSSGLKEVDDAIAAEANPEQQEQQQQQQQQQQQPAAPAPAPVPVPAPQQSVFGGSQGGFGGGGGGAGDVFGSAAPSTGSPFDTAPPAAAEATEAAEAAAATAAEATAAAAAAEEEKKRLQNDRAHDTSPPIVLVEDNEADTLIKQALMVGQFETAVDLCLKNDRTTDALLLAM